MALPLPDPQITPPGKDPGQVKSSLEGAQRNFEKLSVWGTKIEGDIAAIIGGGTTPIGPAGGDLTDNYPNPRIGSGKISNGHVAAGAEIDQSKIAGLGTALAGKVGTSDPRLSDARTPVAHTHAQADITNLTSDLAAKASNAALSAHESDTTAIHGIADTSQLVLTGDSRLSDQRTPSDNSVTSTKIVDGAIVNADVNASAGIAQSKIANLTSDLAGKAALAHTHPQSDVTSLVSDLALKAPLASPGLTGNPTAPDQLPGTGKGPNGDRIANTRYADDADDLVRQGFQMKEPVDYVSTQKPSGTYTVTGNTLEANANGYLFPALGLTADRWTYDLTFQGWDNSGVEDYVAPLHMANSGSYVYTICATGLAHPKEYVLVQYNLNGVRQAQVVIARGTSAGEIDTPTGIGVDSTGKIYISDSANNMVSIWTSSLVYSSRWSASSVPFAMCIDSSDRLTVSHGYVIKRYSLAGTGSTTLSLPGKTYQMSADPFGTVFCASGSDKVYKAPYGLGSYSTISNIDLGLDSYAIAAGGNCFWVMNSNKEIIQYDDGGGYISTSGSAGSGPGQYGWVRTLAAHGIGVFVGDWLNNKIEKLSYASALAANNTVLLRHGNAVPQIPHKDNGIYTINNPGSPSTKWKLTRRDLTLDPGTIVQARFEGSDPQPGMFYMPTPGPVTVGTTPIIFEPYRQRPTAHGQTHAADGADPVGRHASVHASAGSDPFAAGSLDPTVLAANYGSVPSSGSITISTTSSPGTTLASLTVGAGKATLLLGLFLIAMPSTTDYECAIFSGASGGSQVSNRGYLSNHQSTAQWQQTMVWAFVTPSVDTTYRIVSWRAWGSTDATVGTGTGTMISAITLGGTP